MFELLSSDIPNKTADIRCDVCSAHNPAFPLLLAAQKVGGAFSLASATLRGCACNYVTVYPFFADDAVSVALAQMAGL